MDGDLVVGHGTIAPFLDSAPMKADEIRRTYLSFFEERGHRIVPSASLVPSSTTPRCC